MRHRLRLWFVLLLLLGGCSIRREDTLPFAHSRPPVSPDQVTLYDRAPRSYQAISRIEATSVNALSSRADSLAAARRQLIRQAAELGANGILLDRPLGQSADADDLYATELTGLAIWVD